MNEVNSSEKGLTVRNGKETDRMGIVVVGACFVDIKGFPEGNYIPDGRNVGRIEYVHGGVSRNVTEDIANLELRPTFLSIVDDSALGEEVLTKLKKHKVNVDYIRRLPDGLGTWLAVFNSRGDVAGSISKRPDLMPLLDLLEEQGDEIISQADSLVVEMDMNKEILQKLFELAGKYHKKLYSIVSNMSVAAERRDLARKFDCVVCNRQEAGILFMEDYSGKDPEELCEIIYNRMMRAKIPSMVVTMGEKGCVYAEQSGEHGIFPAQKIEVKDTTGAGDAFCAGVSVGLTYGKTLRQSVEIGTRLAASVIISMENVCPRFLPEEFGISMSDHNGD